MKRRLAFAALTLMASSVAMDNPSNHPSAHLTNGLVAADVYLPDAKNGYYVGTRFDWAGVVSSLKAHGHDFYGPWFDDRDPAVHDFVYRDGKIVAGAASAISGPVDEFAPLGYDSAQPGSTFIKIGVGALRKPDAAAYDNYRSYEIADGGHWTIAKHADQIEFTQELNDASSGYAYTYRKTLQLTKDKSQLVLTHHLANKGQHPIETNVYNHNFLVLDSKGPQEGVTITFPFSVKGAEQIDGKLAAIAGSKITYTRTLSAKDVVTTPISGFDLTAAQNGARIDYPSGAAIAFHTDHPLLKLNLWSIRSVLAVEPFINLSIAPGKNGSWTTIYDYSGRT